MQLLFIADAPASFKTYKDTTYAMMREAAARGWSLWHTHSHQLKARQNSVWAQAVPFDVADGADWFQAGETQTRRLVEFDAVLMRSDPPFDLQYLYATQLLSLAETEGARVFNSGQAMRDGNEKLGILNHPQFIAPTLVATEAQAIRDFLAEHGDIIVKPLDGMGGMGIFRLQQGDANTGSILEMLMQNGSRTIMAQRYLPEIAAGDKRILVIGGKVVPYALARVPQQGENRGNLAAGGTGVVQALSPRDREIAETLAPQLKQRGVLLAGLDVIGDCLTEINLTSPTGFQEITRATGFDVAAMFMDELAAAVAAHRATSPTS